MKVYKIIGRPITPNESFMFKVWLVRHNLNQSDFARKCGVSRQYISQIIKGEIYLTPKIIQLFESQGYSIKKDR